jgi:acetyl-CoA acetyltransferase
MFQSCVTAEEVLGSRVVCEPLHLWMLCSPNEGAAAIVLSSSASSASSAGSSSSTSSSSSASGVRLRAAVLRSHLPGYVLNEGTPMCGLIGADPPTPSRMAADAAYEEAGIGPGDLHVVECQDTDAARELLAYEELRLCEPAGSGALLRSGATALGGRLPVNPSGGLLSKGEPLGASALGQAVELVRQLRGTAGARQVEGARVALAHTVGRGANASAVILSN